MDLVEIARFGLEAEAQVIAAALREEGFSPLVAQGGLAAMLGAGWTAIPVRVLVPAVEVDDATVMLEILRSRTAEADADEPTTCAACGEAWEPGFGECWSCGVALGAPTPS